MYMTCTYMYEYMYIRVYIYIGKTGKKALKTSFIKKLEGLQLYTCESEALIVLIYTVILHRISTFSYADVMLYVSPHYF